MLFVAGLGSALLASLLFNGGLVLQALDARAAPKDLGLRVSLLTRLLRQRRWNAGLLLGLVGIAPQLWAYSVAPFVVVQTALAGGLLLLVAVGSRVLGEAIHSPEIFGTIGIVTGVGLVSWGVPSHVEAHRGSLAVVSVVAGLSLVAFAPFAARFVHVDLPMLTIVASGAGFAVTNIATKLFGDDYQLHLIKASIWAVVALALGVVATVTGMTAFQQRDATIVVPVSTAVQIFAPILVEPLFLRERWSSADAGGLPIGVGVLIALGGCVLVTRARASSRVVAAAGGKARPRKRGVRTQAASPRV